jgi:hypothetical protein
MLTSSGVIFHASSYLPLSRAVSLAAATPLAQGTARVEQVFATTCDSFMIQVLQQVMRKFGSVAEFGFLNLSLFYVCKRFAYSAWNLALLNYFESLI